MIPKTEKELELYFLLEELKIAKERAFMPLTMHGTIFMRESSIERYNTLKQDYLIKANEL